MHTPGGNAATGPLAPPAVSPRPGAAGMYRPRGECHDAHAPGRAWVEKPAPDSLRSRGGRGEVRKKTAHELARIGHEGSKRNSATRPRAPGASLRSAFKKGAGALDGHPEVPRGISGRESTSSSRDPPGLKAPLMHTPYEVVRKGLRVIPSAAKDPSSPRERRERQGVLRSTFRMTRRSFRRGLRGPYIRMTPSAFPKQFLIRVSFVFIRGQISIPSSPRRVPHFPPGDSSVRDTRPAPVDFGTHSRRAGIRCCVHRPAHGGSHMIEPSNPVLAKMLDRLFASMVNGPSMKLPAARQPAAGGPGAARPDETSNPGGRCWRWSGRNGP